MIKLEGGQAFKAVKSESATCALMATLLCYSVVCESSMENGLDKHGCCQNRRAFIKNWVMTHDGRGTKKITGFLSDIKNSPC